MNWAFGRKKEAAAVAERTDAADARDPAAALHARTRRRLIGAAALLLAAVIVLPMVLDSTPRPVSDTVAIDIPSDKTPFKPRLSTPAPAAPAPSAVAVRKDEAAPKAEVKPDARPEPKSEPKGESKPEAKTDAKAAEPPAKEAAASSAPAAGQGSFALQAAAFAHESAARDLIARLKKAGFAPYTEKVNTPKGERIRVRVGPFATREEAEQARTRLKSIGIDAGVVSG